MTRLIQFVIILALITQVSHAAWVFGNISQTKGQALDQIMNYIFAISLELSIFIFTMQAKIRTATFFAVISTLINLLYYWFKVGFSLEFCSMLVISPIIPTTIYFYSDLVMNLDVKKEDPQIELEVKRPVGRPKKKPVKVKRIPNDYNSSIVKRNLI
jgi:hypothetical protein